jgi:enoyl-CoA hydratase
MTEPPVVLIEEDGPITILTLNRPAVLNALNKDVVENLARCLARARQTPTTRALVITGSGDRAFCAGADLNELTGLDEAAAHDTLAAGQRVLRAMERSPIPVIAAVNGLALGGGFELMLACTFAVIAEGAGLGLPETGLGLIPGYGGTQRLARAIGTARAAHVMLTGHRIDAASAYRQGLTPVPPIAGDVRAAAVDLARSIASRGPRAVRAVLTAMRTGADAGLDGGLALETALAAQLTAGAEAAEGITAFRERRQPIFADPSPAEGTP